MTRNQPAHSPDLKVYGPHFLAVTLFAATILLLETVFFHVLDYIHDYYQAVMVIGSAILGIGLGSLAAIRLRISTGALFITCCLGLTLALYAACTLILFHPDLWTTILILPLVFFFPGIYIAGMFRDHHGGRVYYFDMIGAFLGVVATYLLYHLLLSESILLLMVLLFPLTGVLVLVARSPFRSLPLRLCFGTSLCFLSGVGLLLLFLQVREDRFNLFKLIPRDHSQLDPTKAFAFHDGDTPVRSFENLVGRVDVIERSSKNRLVAYNGYGNDHFTTRVPKDYAAHAKPRKKKWPTKDIRVLYGVVPEPKVFIMGSSAQGIVKTIRKITPKENITAVEINPAILRIMTEDFYEESGRAYRGINPILGNGLSFLKGSDQLFDIITCINLHSTRTIGYQGAPDYLHTEQSYNLFLDHLTDKGYFLLEERPINRGGDLGFYRMLHTFWRVLAERGAADPGKHFVIWEWGSIGNAYKRYISCIVTKNPIEGSLREGVRAWVDMRSAAGNRMRLGYFKGVREQAAYADLFGMIASGDFSPLAEEHFDTATLTNNRPFASVSTTQTPRLNQLLAVTGIPALLLWLLISAATLSRKNRAGNLKLSGYNLLIGFGYFFVEIVLIERYQNLFVSPSASFVLVLGFCLLSSGFGGFLSPRLTLGRSLVCLIPLCLLAIFLPGWLAVTALPDVLAKVLGIALICATGFFMGVFFPKGLALARAGGQAAKIPHFFAANSVAGSFAVTLALYLGVKLGYGFTLVLACLFFLAAWALSKVRIPVAAAAAEQTPGPVPAGPAFGGLRLPIAAGGLALVVAVVAIGLVVTEPSRYGRAGAAGLTSLATRSIFNMHEHIDTRADARRYLEVAESKGISKTVVLGSYRGILDRTKPRYASVENNNDSVLEMAGTFPDRLIPFVLIRPDQADKLDSFRAMRTQGAAGLHIRGGTGNPRLRIDGPDMWPLYAYCERENIPVMIHFNSGRMDPVRNVLRGFPRLKVCVPHLLYAVKRPERIRSMLERYPNLYTDFSHGYLWWMKKNLKRVSKRTKELRALVRAYPDRFLWGTDDVPTERSLRDEGYLAGIIDTYRNLLEQKTYYFNLMDEPHRPLKGLNLDDDLLDKIYVHNARRFLEQAPRNPKPDPEPAVANEAGPDHESQLATLLLTGSSLPGEGMVRSGGRAANKLVVDPALRNLANSVDIFHMSVETVLPKKLPRREKWKFYSTADDLSVLSQLGVDVVELTGNHLLDYGPSAMKSLIAMLRDKGLGYFGGGLNREDAWQTLSYVVGKNRISFLGFNMVSGKKELAGNKKPGGNAYSRGIMVRWIENAKKDGDLVLVHFQWGDEFNPQPWAHQRQIAHQAIDAGADAVIGTHTHAVAAHETYRGKPIFYGLGNFLFRHDEREATRVGAIVRLHCVDGELAGFEMIPVRNKNGVLSIVQGDDRKRILSRWQAQDSRLSKPEQSVLAPNLAFLHIEKAEVLAQLPTIFKRGGINRARVFLSPTEFAETEPYFRKKAQLRHLVQTGMIFDVEQPGGIELLKRHKPRALALATAAQGTDPIFDYLAKNRLPLVLGPDWRPDEVKRLLDRFGTRLDKIYLDIRFMAADGPTCTRLLERFPKLHLLWCFRDPAVIAERLPAATLETWKNRIRLGATLEFPDRVTGKSAMRNFGARNLMWMRNMLELERVRTPVTELAHKEWGYVYEREKERKGYALPAPVLASMYRY